MAFSDGKDLTITITFPSTGAAITLREGTAVRLNRKREGTSEVMTLFSSDAVLNGTFLPDGNLKAPRGTKFHYTPSDSIYMNIDGSTSWALISA